MKAPPFFTMKYTVKNRPRRYMATPQQHRVLEAAEFCGIKKGISRRELRDKMINCLPQYYKDRKEKPSNEPED